MVAKTLDSNTGFFSATKATTHLEDIGMTTMTSYHRAPKRYAAEIEVLDSFKDGSTKSDGSRSRHPSRKGSWERC